MSTVQVAKGSTFRLFSFMFHNMHHILLHSCLDLRSAERPYACDSENLVAVIFIFLGDGVVITV